MGKKKVRRKYTSEQKAAILRRHLVDKVPISDLCDEYRIHPNQIYKWQKTLMDNLSLAFEGQADDKVDTATKKLEKENRELRAKVAKKDSVIAEMSGEFIALKKELGEL
jgi:transposase